MGFSARSQAGDPCDPSMFNPGVCKVAIKRQGYCQGGWVPMNYSQKYPYYYDEYQRFIAGGGAAVMAPLENCSRPGSHFVTTHGFGTIGTGHHVHAGG
jgi:hypothetical protein